MAIWKEQNSAKNDAPAPTPEPLRSEPVTKPVAQVMESGRRAPDASAKESVIAADLMIEGKIEGTGHVRLAGRFKGEVNVQGHLTIEQGAKCTGGVRAGNVIIGGELDGNIDAASRVELLETGVLIGDLKAGSLTVAAGSRMRGQVEFGWDDKKAPAIRLESNTGT
jgi:cytoskeletal protein CcmA (bactofilin family)